MKKLKKILSSIIPNGHFKELIKLNFYRIFKNNNVDFSILKSSNIIRFQTELENVKIITNEALYPIVDDFQYYSSFYKVKKGDYVIDAGANCGHLSIYYSKLVGNEGKVFAFEPDRHNIQRITSNLALNSGISQIEIEELLIWDKSELIDFNEAGTVGSSVYGQPNSNLLVKKQAVSLDEWIISKKLNKLDFIKMDIEGAEIEALLGCRQLIEKFSPDFAIASYHYVNNQQTYIKLEEFFKSINYPFKTLRLKVNEIITFAGSCVNQKSNS